MDYTVNEDTIQILSAELAAPLPDLFCFRDGSRVQTVADWERRRAEIAEDALDLAYGTQPPEPEFFTLTPLYTNGLVHTYRITSGTHAHPVSFTMYLFLPQGSTPCPVIISGDMCFGVPYQPGYITTVTDAGMALALFNRTEIVPDVPPADGQRHGGLYDTYPDRTFGAIGAWAWAYSRCVDALLQLGIADPTCIVFTGHSRGGKTAALAGARDTRASIVNPNETCAGACSCYRLSVKQRTEGEGSGRSETLADICGRYAFWMGPELPAYVDRVSDLPFDAHSLKALMAPRILFISEACGDAWANPLGSYHTTCAAREVYRFLGKEENLYWYYRPGKHGQTPGDMAHLVNLIRHVRGGDALLPDFYRRPFPEPDPIYDWRAPVVPK